VMDEMSEGQQECTGGRHRIIASRHTVEDIGYSSALDVFDLPNLSSARRQHQTDRQPCFGAATFSVEFQPPWPNSNLVFAPCSRHRNRAFPELNPLRLKALDHRNPGGRARTGRRSSTSPKSHNFVLDTHLLTNQSEFAYPDPETPTPSCLIEAIWSFPEYQDLNIPHHGSRDA
jgi:hypothetical protein